MTNTVTGRNLADAHWSLIENLQKLERVIGKHQLPHGPQQGFTERKRLKDWP